MEIFLILFFIICFIVLSGIKIIDQYERGIILTLGQYSYTLDPGLKIVIPIFQRIIRVDIRISTADIPQQEVITRDNVPVGINAVVYFKVVKPAISFRTNATLPLQLGSSDLDPSVVFGYCKISGID